MVPPEALQLAATELVNCCCPPGASRTELGDMDMPAGGVGVGVGEGAVADTVTVAVSDLLLSAWLVAVTVKVPAEPGAVYIPVEETAPPLAVQLTAVLLVPVTLTVNCCCLLTCKGTLCGLTATAIVPGVVPVVPPFTLPPAQPPIDSMISIDTKTKKVVTHIFLR